MASKLKHMDKKTKTIIGVIAAVVVLGGLYYGYNNWRTNQALKQLYGVDGLNKGLSSGVLENIAKEAAKEEAQQKADEAKEAAKTPEDKFNDTKATTLAGEISPVVASEIEPALKAVFGQSKTTSYGTGYMMSQTDSFGANFKVPRVVTADDLNKLAIELKNKGYNIISNSIESESGSITLMKGENSTMTIAYSDSGTNQEIQVLYWKLTTN